MQVSARILGQEYGLTAEEMNRVLTKLGFLTGEPGNYTPTEKALEYVVEKDFHRGCGGSSWYNRYWTTRTYDDSIKDVLDITDEVKNQVRSELAAARAARSAAQALAREQADAEFLARQAAEAVEVNSITKEHRIVLDEETVKNLKTAGVVGLICLGVTAAGYGIYKATPYVKKWWKKHISKKDEASEEEAQTA